MSDSTVIVLFVQGTREVLVRDGAEVYLPTEKSVRRESISLIAPRGCIVALVGHRICVYRSLEEARHEEHDAITRLFDDRGTELL